MINLVIVVQRFSPFDKVGARRWSKFVHYLQKNEDLKIKVITQNYNFQNSNPWNIEIDREKVEIIYVSDIFSSIKKSLPFLNKPIDYIQYKLFKYTDEGYGFSKKAFNYLKKERLELKPDVIVASSPAYSTCYFASKYKSIFPKTKLINDFRDAWIDGFFSWNLGDKSSHPTYTKQVDMELFALNNCDVVVSVTPELVEKLKFKVTNPKVDTLLVTNGFDRRDLIDANLDYPLQFDKKKQNICHFGTLDFGRDDEFLRFITSATLPDNFIIYLIGTISNKLKMKLSGFKSVVHFEQMQPDTLHSFLYYADFHLIVNDSEFYYAYGSKVFNAMLYKKPLIFISKENSLIKKYKTNIGFFFTDGSTNSNEEMIKKISSFKYDANEMPSYPEFDIETLSRQYYNIISN
jgi:hypothetical protein